jgi:hypothetical protein
MRELFGFLGQVERKVQLLGSPAQWVLGFPNWAGHPTRQVEHLFKTSHQAGFWIDIHLSGLKSKIQNPKSKIQNPLTYLRANIRNWQSGYFLEITDIGTTSKDIIVIALDRI